MNSDSKNRNHREKCPHCGAEPINEKRWVSHVEACQSQSEIVKAFDLGAWELLKAAFVVSKNELEGVGSSRLSRIQDRIAETTKRSVDFCVLLFLLSMFILARELRKRPRLDEAVGLFVVVLGWLVFAWIVFQLWG